MKLGPPAPATSGPPPTRPEPNSNAADTPSQRKNGRPSPTNLGRRPDGGASSKRISKLPNAPSPASTRPPSTPGNPGRHSAHPSRTRHLHLSRMPGRPQRPTRQLSLRLRSLSKTTGRRGWTNCSHGPTRPPDAARHSKPNGRQAASTPRGPNEKPRPSPKPGAKPRPGIRPRSRCKDAVRAQPRTSSLIQLSIQLERISPQASLKGAPSARAGQPVRPAFLPSQPGTCHSRRGRRSMTGPLECAGRRSGVRRLAGCRRSARCRSLPRRRV